MDELGLERDISPITSLAGAKGLNFCIRGDSQGSGRPSNNHWSQYKTYYLVTAFWCSFGDRSEKDLWRQSEFGHDIRQDASRATITLKHQYS